MERIPSSPATAPIPAHRTTDRPAKTAMPPPEPITTVGWILVPRIPCAFATSGSSTRPPCGYILDRCRNCLLDGTRADLHDPIEHDAPSDR